MKRLYLLLSLLLSAGFLRGEDEVTAEVAAIGMLPKQRTAQRLAPTERNPFAAKAKEAAKVAADETETQESKIRSVFKAMRVDGIRRASDGMLVALVGDLILREGEQVKPVLPDQTELLMVSKIETKKLELTFVENKDATQPRTIVLPINNQPRVAQKLFGQTKGAREMYYPAMRAAAVGVATVLNVAGGSGAASPDPAHSPATSSGSSEELASGIGVITAPPPPPSNVAASERSSFAALAPGGPRSAAGEPHPTGTTGQTAAASPPAQKSTPSSPVATAIHPPPLRIEGDPSPRPASEIANPGSRPNLGSSASPIRLAVPPPAPAKPRPLIE